MRVKAWVRTAEDGDSSSQQTLLVVFWMSLWRESSEEETNESRLLWIEVPYKPGGELRSKNSMKIPTLRFLINQAGEALCCEGERQSVLTRAAHLLQL